MNCFKFIQLSLFCGLTALSTAGAETKENPEILRPGEINMARHYAVISVSDSAEAAPYRPGSMYDGKNETAWITGPVQNDHDIEAHWFKRNVSVGGVRLDTTPADYNYRRSYSMLSIHAGMVPASFKGKSSLPENIKIELKQYGKWQTVGTYPVKGNLFSCRFPEMKHDVQRLRLSFTTVSGKRVAIREI